MFPFNKTIETYHRLHSSLFPTTSNICSPCETVAGKTLNQFPLLYLTMVQAPIFFVMGVSGSGKTTVGQLLSAETNIPFFDADDYHSETNKEKMRSGTPLNDDDRAGWLGAINQLAITQSVLKGAIIACSALKKKYRETLIRNISSPVQWIFLQGEYALIKERLNTRPGHYMGADLLQSQFDITEIPSEAVIINITKPPAEIVSTIISDLNLKKIH